MQPHTSPQRNMYTAKTLTLSKAALAAEREAEEQAWGTMDPSPVRVAGPGRSNLFDWGMALAMVGILGMGTVMAGGTMLAAGAVVLLQSDASSALGSVGSLSLMSNEPAPKAIPATPASLDQLEAATADAPVEAKATAKPARKRAAPARTRNNSPRTTAARTAPAPRSAPPTPARSGESAMSLSQLKNYLTDAPAAAPTTPVAPPPPAAPVSAPTRAPAAPAPMAASDADDELAELLAEPMPAPRATTVTRSQGTASPAAAPAAAGVKRLSSRLSKAPNGVLILDEPLDPVPVAVATDDDAAIYVDGELLGGAPLAVVLDRGSHEVTVQSEKGTASFDLDASEGDKWCFSVKRGPKLGACR